MAEVEQEVETRFKVADDATKHLSAMHKAAEKLSHSFEKATDLVGDLAGVAGAAGLALGIKGAIEGSMEYVGAMSRISQLTGDTVEKTVGLSETMGKFGIRGDEAERTLLRMSKRGAALEEATAGATGHVGGMASEFKRLGVNMKNGPETALLSISKQVSKGKMGVGEVSRLLGVMPRQALNLMGLLKQGPEKLKESIDEAAKNSPISMSTVEQYRRIKVLGNEIAQAWEQIKVRIGVKLMPVIEHLMEFVKSNLDEWVDKATEFGKTLGSFLDKHGKQIAMIGKLLLANYALTKVTGKGMNEWAPLLAKGMVGLGRGAMGAGAKAMAGGGAGLMSMNLAAPLTVVSAKISAISAAVTALAPVLAIAAAVIAAIAAVVVPGVIALRTNFEGMTTKIMSVVAKIVAYWDVFTGLLHGSGGMLTRLGKFFSRESAFGRFFMRLLPGGILIAANAFEGILHTVFTIALFFERIGEMGAYLAEGLGSTLSGLWDEAVGIFQSVVKWVRGIFTTTTDGVSSFAKTVLDFFKPMFDRVRGFYDMVSGSIGAVFDAIKAKLAPIAKVFGVVVDAGKDLVSAPVAMWKQAWNDVESATNAQMAKGKRAEQVMRRETPGARPGMTQVFNNARFDITQKFAENFDPDRISVAFTNDLASLGERKLQSGFSPLFAVR